MKNEALGVIDVGSHAARLGIYQARDGNVEELENLSVPLLLGKDVFTSGKISMRNIRLATEIISDFANVMAEYGVSRYRAFTTSAVREAINSAVFIERVKCACGVDVRILEPAEEVKLTCLAVRDRLKGSLSLKNRHAVICNIGTGSTQFSLLENGRVVNMLSLNFGTLRLREIIEDAHTGARDIHQAIEDFTDNLVSSIARLTPNLVADTLVVTGGNTRCLLNITHHSKKIVNFASLGVKELRSVEKKIAGVPPERLAETYGISDHYAVGLEPCCIFIDKLIASTSAKKASIVVTDTRSVVLRDMLVEVGDGSDEFDKDVVAAAKFMGRKYNYDEDHAKHVRHLALTLFDATSAHHRLGNRDKLLLEVAAILHDIGQFIDTRQHHKHSMYLVGNTQIPGLSSEEIRLVSLVARYHRKAMPRRSHAEFVALPPEQRMRVSALAALLRVADAFDRSHDARVEITSATAKGKNFNIIISSPKDVSLEMLSLSKKQDLFQNYFCLTVKVSVR